MRKILKNASYLFISNALVRFLTSLATILVARYLGSAEYGILSVAIAFTTIAAYFTDMGLSNTFLREATKKDISIEKLTGSYLKVRFLFALATVVVSYFIVETIYTDENMKLIIYYILIPTVIGASFQGLGVVYFQALQKMHFTALIRGLSGILTASTLFIGLIFEWPLKILALIYGLSGILGGLISILLIGNKISFRTRYNSGITKGLFSFSINGLIIMALPQLGPIVLEKVTAISEVGYFSAAYKIPSGLYQIPGIVAAAFYPVLFSYGNNKDLGNHLKLNVLQLKLMSTLGIFMTLPFFVYSGWWINIFYGSKWESATSILQILSFIVLLQSINYPLADGLTTLGRQKSRTIVISISFFIGILCYILLGKFLGARGGAVSAIIVELTQFIGYFIFSNNKKKIFSNGIKQALFIILIVLFASKLLNYLNPVAGLPILIILISTLVILFNRDLYSQLYPIIRKKFSV
ncbi:oligosaccharide flippase family protein [Heyndrickxia faecalis]|uniref:oligosaccharide flippase family protein n=1 Tax=Heyndrickxia faecalis TaxID=2824910 RepID=UPI003D210CB6